MGGASAPSFEEQKRIWDTLNLGLDSVFFNRILSSHIHRSKQVILRGQSWYHYSC